MTPQDTVGWLAWLWWNAGWIAIHGVWIAAAIGLLTLAVGRLARLGARGRYVLASAALGGLAVGLPLVAAWTARQADRPAVVGTAPIAVARSDVRAPRVADAAVVAPASTGRWLAVGRQAFAWLWLLSTAIGCLYIARAVVSARRLSAGARPCEDPVVHDGVARAAAALGLRRPPRVRCSPQLRGPVVIGVWRPTLLLPSSMVTDWTAADLDLVLLHECAHVRRRDPLALCLQRACELLLWAHPAVRWLSRQICLERERCCDALAVRHSGRPHAYARALVALASPSHPTIGLAMGRSPLVERVASVLNQEMSVMQSSRRSILSMTALGVLGLAAVAVRAQDPAPACPRACCRAAAETPAETPVATSGEQAQCEREEKRQQDQREALLAYISAHGFAHGQMPPNVKCSDCHTVGSVGRAYTVRAGDSLMRIARNELGDARYVERLAKANALVDPRRLAVGQQLWLPPVHEARTENPLLQEPAGGDQAAASAERAIARDDETAVLRERITKLEETVRLLQEELAAKRRGRRKGR